MKISFNPSNSNKNILDLIKSNKDIIFDLKGHNIFARGVEFKGTDTNTWRPVVDNLTSNSTTSSLSANQGRVLAGLINGKSDSDHNHDGRYVRYYTVTTLDCNNLASGLTVARVNATNAASAHHSAYLYISDVGTPFQIQIPDSDTSFIYKRYYSSGKWSGWFKLNAGYADSAGSVAWANVTNKPATATRWPSWAEVTGKPSSFTPADHNHDNKYLRWLGNAGQSNMNAIGRISHSSGMTALSDPGNTVDNPMEGSAKSTSWHLYWQTNYTDTPSGSNAWVAQIVNRAGTDRWWVRSRNGGTITNGTGWTSNWRFLVTAPTSGLGNGNQPIYINSAGEVVAANSYPTSLKSPHSLTLKANGTTLAVYDGSSVKEANFTYANVGAASASHNHDERYVKSFGTSNDNIDSDWGQSFKTFDPIPSGTPPEKNSNISLLSIGNSFSRRKQLAFTYNNDNIYYRRRADIGFTNWRRIAFANEIPSSLKNPHALTISLNGTSQGPYDGSVAKNINITPGSIGAATSGHNHDGRYVYNYGGIQMDGASVNKNALGMSTTSGITGDWWHILQAAWNGEYRWNSQIAFPTQNRNGMYYRSGLDDNTKWGSWIKLLDIGNSYVKDGKGIINGTTITKVNNADTLDGAHLIRYGNGTGIKQVYYFHTQGNNTSYIKLGTLNTVAVTGAASSKVMFTVKGGINFGGTNESVYEVAASTRGSIQVTSTLVRGNRELKFGYVSTSSNVEIWMAYDGTFRGVTEVEVSSSVRFTLAMTETTTKPSGFVEGSYRILASTADNVASATNAYHLRINSANTWSTWNWAGQSGQPTWLWGSNDGINMYVWNPSSFKVAYSTSAGNADTVDGYHASYSSNTPWGTIPVITTQGFMDIGKHLEFHHDNTTGSDYSTILMCTGNYSNIVDLPSESGTLALLSQVISTSNFNWTNLPGKVVAGNEFNIVNAGYNSELWFNYLPIDNRNSSAAISQYNMGNGNKGLASVYAYRFKAEGNPCMWKDARNYAPFYATFNGGFEPILDIKTKGGDWSIGSYDAFGNHLIFAFTSDSDFNAGVNGTANYWLSQGGEFKINTLRLAGAITENMGVGSTNPQIIFAEDSTTQQVAITYTDWDTYRVSKGLKVHSYDGSEDANVWFEVQGYNYSSGYVKNGSSDAYVLLGGGGHKPLSQFQLGSGSYLPYNGWWNNGSGQDVNDANGMIFAYASHKNSPFSSSWGIITTFDYTYDSNYKFQLAANGYSNAMYYRSRSSDRGGWTSWAQVIDTGNISSQRVAYATSAGSVSNSLNIFGVSYNGSAAKTVTTSTFVSQLPEGTSTVTDGTMFITSWASDSGFADTNAVNVPYKRKASCLWNYIDSKVSSKYLPLAGGTMNGNARIGHGSGNLYIGNSGNDGWVYTQDIASQSGTDKWWVRESGAAHFGNVYICTKSDYTTYNSSIIECYTGNNLYLNYYSPRGVNLCNGGGTVQIGPYTTGDTGNNKLFVNGSEFIQGASNVRNHVFANGFRHRSHNSNDSVLLAGGGYSQGVPVRYWAIYSMYIGNSSTDVTYTRRGGNYDFITSKIWESEGIAIFDINFPSGYNKNNTLIFGNGDHRTSSQWRTPVYATITTHTSFGSASQIRVMISDDASFNTGFANIYFMCMG